MHIKKLNRSIELLKEFLGDSLIICDVWITNSSHSIAGYNNQTSIATNFDKSTEAIKNSLNDSGFPILGKYYFIDCEEDTLLIIMNFGKYQWGIMLKKSLVQMSMLINLILPSVSKEFNDAMNN
jgi:hypothetical protein